MKNCGAKLAFCIYKTAELCSAPSFFIINSSLFIKKVASKNSETTFDFLEFLVYSGEIASIGQTPAQAPQSMQADESIT
jgi:hypothetical protein